MNSRARNQTVLKNVYVLTLMVVALVYVAPYFLYPSGWFGDDFGVLYYAQRNLHSSWSDMFVYKDVGMQRYRPFMQMFVTLTHRYFGFNSLLIRAASYLAFLSILASLYWLLRSFKSAGSTRMAALIGLVWFAVVPIKMQALARPGRPEIFVAAFCFLAILCQQKAWGPGEPTAIPLRRAIWLLASVSFAIGAALWAEFGISVFLVLGVWIVAPLLLSSGAIAGNFSVRVRTILGRLLVPMTGLAVYLTWYRAVGAPFQSGAAATDRYRVHFGLDTCRNVGISIAGVLSPVASPTGARIAAHYSGVLDWVELIVGTISFGILTVIVLRVLPKEWQPIKVAAVFFFSAIASLGAFVLGGHVSEVYLVQSAAFMSGCIGVLFAATIEKMSLRASRVFFAAGAALVGVMLASSTDAFSLMKHNADAFSVLHADLVRHQRFDGNDRFVLIPPCVHPLQFSQYYIPYNLMLSYQDMNLPEVTWLSDCKARPSPKENAKNVYQVDMSGRLQTISLR